MNSHIENGYAVSWYSLLSQVDTFGCQTALFGRKGLNHIRAPQASAQISMRVKHDICWKKAVSKPHFKIACMPGGWHAEYGNNVT